MRLTQSSRMKGAMAWRSCSGKCRYTDIGFLPHIRSSPVKEEPLKQRTMVSVKRNRIFVESVLQADCKNSSLKPFFLGQYAHNCKNGHITRGDDFIPGWRKLQSCQKSLKRSEAK